MAASIVIIIVVLSFDFLKWILPIIKEEIDYRSPGLCGRIWLGMSILGFICILLKFISEGA